jgi:hypothetical protein
LISQGAGRLTGLAAVAVLLHAGCGSETKPGTPAPEAADARATVDKDERDDGHRLRLGDRGSPVIWVRRGRDVAVHSSPGGPVVRRVGDETEFGSKRTFAVFRRAGGWAAVPNPFTGNGELGWVRLDRRKLAAGYTTQEVVVDLSDRRAELFRHGGSVRAFTVSVGAPESTTPTGRFAVTDTFRGGLNPAYGCCAVALTAEQPNLPSGWIGGNRIAIHGTSGPLGAAISSGCVRAADRDVSALVDVVPPGVPVTVRQ